MAKFSKIILKDLVNYDADENLYKTIKDTITDNGRWSINHSLIFTTLEDNKYYRTSYSVAATEYQGERPFDYDPDEIECEEVFPVDKVITVYKSQAEINP